LLRMGEDPARVFCVGGLGDENIRAVPRMTPAELSQSLGFDLTEPFALVTFHPETAAGSASPTEQMQALLCAMEDAHRDSGLRYLITKSNADAGGSDINAMIDAWSASHAGYAAAFTSLGLRRYLSAMAGAAVVLGNSSSGVVETPSFGVPTVNIGKRQEGRIICSNVICCDAERQSIFAALQKAQSPEFKAVAAATVSPYHGDNTSGDIVRIIAEQLAGPLLSEAKVFYDYPCKEEQA
ncbi:MAG: UDP-N-acetylglucosamine 2-epimerase, partial [Oscillospiraceae bacterium]|nr:UDP-N-acetylglucosamine 2-epimerase [Oscillospiraceae bacterium]